MRNLDPPLGYKGIIIDDVKLNKIIFCLNIKDHGGKVFYPEVLFSIFHSIVGVNDEKVKDCDQVKNILKMLKQKYKSQLSKKLDLDTICGNRFYRTEQTASKILAASAILKRWRAFKNRKV